MQGTNSLLRRSHPDQEGTKVPFTGKHFFHYFQFLCNLIFVLSEQDRFILDQCEMIFTKLFLCILQKILESAPNLR